MDTGVGWHFLSRGSSQPRGWTQLSFLAGECFEGESESHSVVYNSLQPHGLYNPWNSPGQNTGVGSCSLLQRIFPTQGSNPGILHCRHTLYQLSHREAYHWANLDEGFPGGTSGKEPTCRCSSLRRWGFDPWAKKIPWRREQQLTPVFWPGESHGQRSLMGHGP